MMMMKMLKMMKPNVLLEMRHLLSMGMPVYSRLHKVADYPENRFGVFLALMFVMGVIDYGDGSTWMISGVRL